jgi:hypothetical protein
MLPLSPSSLAIVQNLQAAVAIGSGNVANDTLRKTTATAAAKKSSSIRPAGWTTLAAVMLNALARRIAM